MTWPLCPFFFYSRRPCWLVGGVIGHNF